MPIPHGTVLGVAITGASDTGSTVTVRAPADLRDEWLTEILTGAGVLRDGARVGGHRSTPIGTGQMSESHRVRLCYAPSGHGPGSVVLKVAASDATSRSTGTALGAYAREVRFYREIGATLGDPVAACYHAEGRARDGLVHAACSRISPPARQGDEIAGGSGGGRGAGRRRPRGHPGRALGRRDAPRALRWLNASSPLDQGLLTAVASRLCGALRRPPRRGAPCAGQAVRAEARRVVRGRRRRRTALEHGDYRLDNLLFASDRARGR